MKKLTAVLLSLLMVLSLCACGSDQGQYVPPGNCLGEADPPSDSTQQQDQVLTLTYYREETLNPLYCTDYTNKLLFSLLYEGLFCVDRDYKVEPMLCKSYRISEDMRTYTFYLEKASFSNGAPLTADDVVQTLLAAKESKVYGGRFFHITGVQASEDGGVQVSTDTPLKISPCCWIFPLYLQTS